MTVDVSVLGTRDLGNSRGSECRVTVPNISQSKL